MYPQNRSKPDSSDCADTCKHPVAIILGQAAVFTLEFLERPVLFLSAFIHRYYRSDKATQQKADRKKPVIGREAVSRNDADRLELWRYQGDRIVGRAPTAVLEHQDGRGNTGLSKHAIRRERIPHQRRSFL
jgi:hypothetical protein